MEQRVRPGFGTETPAGWELARRRDGSGGRRDAGTSTVGCGSGGRWSFAQPTADNARSFSVDVGIGTIERHIFLLCALHGRSYVRIPRSRPALRLKSWGLSSYRGSVLSAESPAVRSGEFVYGDFTTAIRTPLSVSGQVRATVPALNVRVVSRRRSTGPGSQGENHVTNAHILPIYNDCT